MTVISSYKDIGIERGCFVRTCDHRAVFFLVFLHVHDHMFETNLDFGVKIGVKLRVRKSRYIYDNKILSRIFESRMQICSANV